MYVYVRKYAVHHNMIYTMYIIYQNRILYTLVVSQNVASDILEGPSFSLICDSKS